MTSARLTIDLGALAHNYRVLARVAGGAELAPVVKADGYGLGAVPIARRLRAEGARAFFVARLSEGEALRAALGDRECEIFVLDGLADPAAAARLQAAALTPVLGSLDEIDGWAAAAGAGSAAPCAVHIDTGMNRLGVPVGQAQAAAARLAAAGLDLRLVMSHLSYAAEPAHPRNAEQLSRFQAAAAAFPGARLSLSASAGAFLGPAFRFDVVRPGISLYGGGPQERPHPDLKAVAILEAPILQVRDVAAGQWAGYGAMFSAPRDMRIGVVAAGYADGVLRTSHRTARAFIGGRPAPLAIVTMDLIAVDLTDCPQAAPGDLVELLGPHALLDDCAAAADTVAHECLVRLSSRAERIYRD